MEVTNFAQVKDLKPECSPNLHFICVMNYDSYCMSHTVWLIVCQQFIIILEYCESRPQSQFQIWIVDSLLRSWLFS